MLMQSCGCLVLSSPEVHAALLQGLLHKVDLAALPASHQQQLLNSFQRTGQARSSFMSIPVPGTSSQAGSSRRGLGRGGRSSTGRGGSRHSAASTALALSSVDLFVPPWTVTEMFRQEDLLKVGPHTAHSWYTSMRYLGLMPAWHRCCHGGQKQVACSMRPEAAA